VLLEDLGEAAHDPEKHVLPDGRPIEWAMIWSSG
jgi:hypothetical protein